MGRSVPTTRGTPASEQLEELTRLSGGDPVLKGLLARGGPVTRERYINNAYGADVPDPWTAEHELEIPGPLQDHTKVTG